MAVVTPATAASRAAASWATPRALPPGSRLSRLRLPLGEVMELRAGGVGNGDGERCALDLRGPAGHVAEHVDGEGDVGPPGDGEWLPVVERLELGELIGVLLHEIGQPPQGLAPLGG